MTESLVSKIKSFCNLLRDAGLGYRDYLEQLTYLLFLKMAVEYSKKTLCRDLQDLVSKNVYKETGEKRGRKYHLR